MIYMAKALRKVIKPGLHAEVFRFSLQSDLWYKALPLKKGRASQYQQVLWRVKCPEGRDGKCRAAVDIWDRSLSIALYLRDCKLSSNNTCKACRAHLRDRDGHSHLETRIVNWGVFWSHRPQRPWENCYDSPSWANPTNSIRHVPPNQQVFSACNNCSRIMITMSTEQWSMKRIMDRVFKFCRA